MLRFPRSTRRALAAAILTAALSASIVATAAAPASAHTPNVSATCSTLAVNLQSYAWSQSNPRPNKVSVTVDGANLATEWFGGSFKRDFSLGDATKPHTWRVVIDAIDNYDRTYEGTSTPCAPPTPKDAAATLHTTPASCTVPGTLVLDSIANATWSVPTRTQGPGDYAVTATAARGHLFDDGTASRAFTGTLPGALGTSAPGCAPTPPPPTTPPTTTPPTTNPPTPPTPPTPPQVTPVPPKPAPVLTSSRIVSIECDDDLMTTTTTTVVTDWVLNAAGTDWVPGEPVLTTSTATRQVIPGDCPAVGGGGGTGGDDGPTPPTPGVDDGGGTGAGDGTGAGAGDGTEDTGGIVGGIFGLGAGVDALAHSGANAMPAIFLAISLLAAGGIVLLRRRAGDTAPSAATQDSGTLTD